jgi:gluconolactonase
MSTGLVGFRLRNEDFSVFGEGLTRPECVWCDADGVWASDNQAGGVARVGLEGNRPLGSGIHEPNGYSRRANGAFVVAGLEDHKVFEIAPDGSTRVLLEAVDGRPLGVVNCACVDRQDRVWISVMTQRPRWYDALNAGPEGSILLLENGKARVVAEGLHLTNEVKLGPDGRHLYAVESLGKRIVRFAVGADGSLGARQTVGPDSLGYGAFPDGFAFDAEGNIWVTLITRNAIAVIDRGGALHTVFEEVNEAAVKSLVEAMAAKRASREMLAACYGPTLKLPTSLAFGGADRRTAYIGSLAGTSLMSFRSPVPG